ENVLEHRIARYEGRELLRISLDLGDAAEAVVRLLDLEQRVRLDRFGKAKRRCLCRRPKVGRGVDGVLEVVNIAKRPVWRSPRTSGEASGIQLLHATDHDTDERMRNVASFGRCEGVALAAQDA